LQIPVRPEFANAQPNIYWEASQRKKMGRFNGERLVRPKALTGAELDLFGTLSDFIGSTTSIVFDILGRRAQQPFSAMLLPNKRPPHEQTEL
jgi:hypothetical protein